VLFDSVPNTGYTADTIWTGLAPEDKPPITTLGIDPGEELSDLEEPLVYVEHDKGGHTPYGYSFEECDSTERFYSEFVDGYDDIEPLYRRSVRRSMKRFVAMLSKLDAAGILSRTLVIFTSDHGELLGDPAYGCRFGHTTPICPELVTVPIVFLGADLPQDKKLSSIVSGIDIAPTALGARGQSVPNRMTGRNLWNRAPTDRHRSELWLRRKTRGWGFTPYKATSVWDDEGGYVYHRGNRVQRTAVAAYKNYYRAPHAQLVRSRWSPVAQKGFLETHLPSTVRYGTPGGSSDDFEQHTPDTFRRGGQQSPAQMDTEREEAFRRMGYL